METIEPYNKEITYTDLAKWFILTYCHPKILRDAHKDDPLQRDTEKHKERLDQERDERLKAWRIWQGNKTEKNATAVLEEIADEINFLLFKGGVVAGYQKMRRE